MFTVPDQNFESVPSHYGVYCKTPQVLWGTIILANYRTYIKLMIDGMPSKAFSARTLPPYARETSIIRDQNFKRELLLSEAFNEASTRMRWF
jgi:hypothetical protein